jgi:hypothetical protein
METKDLIDAIAAGNSRATQEAFEDIMRERVAGLIDDRRKEIAASMFESQSSGAIDDLNRRSRGILAKPKAAPEPHEDDIGKQTSRKRY